MKIYMIGIGGISMSALALMLANEGHIILGSDIKYNEQIQELTKKNIIRFQLDSSPSFVRQCDIVVISNAISMDNKDLILAKKLGKQILTRADVLGYFSSKKKTIAISGSHGKTTTTGMISEILTEANKSPLVHIGGIMKQNASNVVLGSGDLFLTEACEYCDSFLKINTQIAVILNVKPEHLDFFHTFDNEKKSYQKFIDNVPTDGKVIVNNDDQTISSMKLGDNVISFGLEREADFKAEIVKEYIPGKFSFHIFHKGKDIGEIFLSCFGRHNIYNALASFVVGYSVGLTFEECKKGIENFQGIKRRFEVIKENKFYTVIHDYAHHPDEIQEIIKLSKQLNFDRVITIFQPHTYSRTKDFYNDFLDVFTLCDELWLLPIYPAREKPIKGISSFQMKKDCVDKRNIKAKYFKNFIKCREEIVKNIGNKTLFLILGAGDIVNLAYSFL